MAYTQGKLPKIAGWIKHGAVDGHGPVWELITDRHESLASIEIDGAGEYVAGISLRIGDRWVCHGRKFADIGSAQNWARGLVCDEFRRG